MLTVVYKKNKTIWVFPTAPKRAPLRNICFIPTILNKEQHECIQVRVNEDGTLIKLTDVTNLIVYILSIATENIGGDDSWINANN